MVVCRDEVFDALAPAFRMGSPAREDLLEEALQQGARGEVLELVERLPARRFDDMRDVWSEFPEVVDA